MTTITFYSNEDRYLKARYYAIVYKPLYRVVGVSGIRKGRFTVFFESEDAAIAFEDMLEEEEA